ncbi:MAG: hypothetical protein ACAI35_23140 [Candidatus Methylacidiphilales bacterium]|nr:hypothetical protein [Candidatus Methylacidiphilales bacterium]
MSEVLLSSVERARLISSRLPEGGLFSEKSWRISPRPFPLSSRHVKHLERLGHLLHSFNKACNLLYRRSVEGKMPAWIHQLLDAGKPPELREVARDSRIKGQVPAVIRPDLILTEEGFAISELDSVPAGIGLTAWQNETYADLGEPVLGGRDGMRNGFNGILPQNGHVVYSEESAGFIPEMKWLLGDKDRVHPAETYQANGAPIYRFFECFDWPTLNTFRDSWQPGQAMTPPPKPYMEEKLWLALFWSRPLQEYWRQELSEKGQKQLQEFIPYSWVMDPQPLPPHAVIPELNIHDWAELGNFSQKQRDLVLKISGFSPNAWGSRGVYIGSDMPTPDWQAAVKQALEEFDTHPHVLQRFIKGAVSTHPYLNEETGEMVEMKGRARICPYYFVVNDKAQLGGVLVTFCPADKKLLHGMTDAIICPAIAAEEE